jgi:formylglycine-generating enzyme required for sulfatase activity
LGLSDLIGNVWEWVEDCYHADYRKAPDGARAVIDEKCEMHVLRGGGWSSIPGDARSAKRVGDRPGKRSGGLGFRLARTLP